MIVLAFAVVADVSRDCVVVVVVVRVLHTTTAFPAVAISTPSTLTMFSFGTVGSIQGFSCFVSNEEQSHAVPKHNKTQAGKPPHSVWTVWKPGYHRNGR